MSVRHTFLARGNTYQIKTLTTGKAIREFCFQCYGWDGDYKKSVRECPSKNCALWPFRVGKDPGRQEGARRGGNAVNLGRETPRIRGI